MALIHQATLVPTKLELLAGWLPSRPWAGGATSVRSVGAYRFDDPAGRVGIESLLVQADADAPVLHVPLTYREAPAVGAEEHLIGTVEHSVLGTRWVYDGCADPVWAAALATAVLTGGTQVEELVDAGDGRLVARPPTATVVGSGTPGAPIADQVAGINAVATHDGDATTVVRAGGLELLVVRVVVAGGLDTRPLIGETLTGRWADGGPAVLAAVRPF